jgi:hypothetical protein
MLLAMVSAALGLSANPPGIHPRPAASDYPASDSSGSLTIAAAVLPAEQVRNTFATDLNHGYIVLEVAVYPRAATSIDVSSLDFALRIGATDVVRAATPRAIASILQQKNAGPPPRSSDVTLYPTADVGVVGGPGGRAVYTGAGVGVGIGDQGQPPRPGSTDRDRMTMGQELEDRALPEGKTAQAVAGYLYFPMTTAKRKNVAYELMYNAAGSRLRVLLPPADAKH